MRVCCRGGAPSSLLSSKVKAIAGQGAGLLLRGEPLILCCLQKAKGAGEISPG